MAFLATVINCKSLKWSSILDVEMVKYRQCTEYSFGLLTANLPTIIPG